MSFWWKNLEVSINHTGFEALLRLNVLRNIFVLGGMTARHVQLALDQWCCSI